MSGNPDLTSQLSITALVALALVACGDGKKSDTDADADADDTAGDTETDIPVDTAFDTLVDTLGDPDVIEDTGGDTAEDTAEDSAADPAPDPVEDPVADPVEDTPPDTTPDTTPDTVPDTTPDTVPDTTPDTTMDTVVDTGPDTTVDTFDAPETTTCPDDTYEDNDTDTTPTTGITTGSYTGLRICPGDDDYYAVDLAVGDGLFVYLSFLDAEGDIDVEIIDPTGTTLIWGDSTSDDETVGIMASTAGTYLIYVYLYADAGTSIGNDYDMDVTLGPCTEDTHEDNDDTTTASAVTAGTTYTGLRLCPSDDDYYVIRLFSGDVITVDLTFSDAEGDIDLELLDSTGTDLDGSYSTTDDESVTYTITADGAYYIYAYLYADDGTAFGNDYSMTVTVP